MEQQKRNKPKKEEYFEVCFTDEDIEKIVLIVLQRITEELGKQGRDDNEQHGRLDS